MGCPASASIRYLLKVPFSQETMEDKLNEETLDSCPFEVYTFKKGKKEEYYVEIDSSQSVCNCEAVITLKNHKISKAMEKFEKESKAWIKKHMKVTVKPAKWCLVCNLSY